MSNSALTNSTIFSCGSNKLNVLALDDATLKQQPENYIFDKPVPIDETKFKECRIVKVFSGYNHSIFLDENGRVFGIGCNLHHQLGLGTTSFAYKPTLISELSGMVIVNCVLGHSTSIFENDRGELYGVGYNMSFEMGIDNDHHFLRIVPLEVFNSRPSLFKLPFKQILLGQDMFNDISWSAFLTRDSKIFIANPRVFDAKYVKRCFTKNKALYKLKTELFTTDIIEKLAGTKKRLIILTKKGNVFRQREKVFSKLTLPLRKDEIVEDVFDSDYFEIYRTSLNRFYGAGFAFTSVTDIQNYESVGLITFGLPSSVNITNIYFGQKTLFFYGTDSNMYSMGFNASGQSGIGEVYQLVKSPHKVLLDPTILKEGEMFAVAPGYSHTYFYITASNSSNTIMPNIYMSTEYLFRRHLFDLTDAESGFSDMMVKLLQ